jgi:hypothetical protein
MERSATWGPSLPSARQGSRAPDSVCVRDFLARKATHAKIGGFRLARPADSGSHRAAAKLDEPGLVQTPDVVVCRQDSLPRARPIEAGAVIERQHSRDNRSDGEISTCLGGEKLFYCGRVAEVPRCWDS